MASKRIAFVTMNLHEGYPALLWPGIVDGARELGYECCCLPVSRMFSDDHAEQQEGALTMFLNRKRFSGMVLATNLFGHAAKTQRMEQFIRNSGLPCTTIGNPVIGWPCVSVDNVAGMRELVLGFIDRQKIKRFAYVRGPIGHDEAETRYQTFVNTLASRQIKFDPALLFQGDFNRPAGIAAGKELAKRRGQYDAVLCANDIMAFAVMETLSDAGIRIPADVLVGGFDDMPECRSSSPPLASVRQPIHEQSRQAVIALDRLIRGEATVNSLQLPSNAVFRRSCGVFPDTIERVGSDRLVTGDWKAQLLPQAGADAHQQNRLTDLLNSVDPAGKKLDLVHALDRLTALAATDLRFGGELTTWHNLLSDLTPLLRRIGSAEQWPAFERFLHQSRILLAEIGEQHEGQRRTEYINLSENLNTLAMAISTTFDRATIRQFLLDGLGDVGVPSFALVEYAKPLNYSSGDWVAPEEALVTACLVEGKVVDLSRHQVRFNPVGVICDSLADEALAGISVIHPLVVDSMHYGYILFRMGPMQGSVYHILRTNVASSIKASLMIEADHERELRELQRVQNLELEVRPMIISIEEVARIALDRLGVLEQLLASSDQSSVSLGEVMASTQGVKENARIMTDLIGMIDDIAVRINLLSINASIESARAGTHGKGFAVISAEVRKLAETTAENAHSATQALVKVVSQIDFAAKKSNESVQTFAALKKEIVDLEASFRDISTRMQGLDGTSRRIISMFS